MTIFLYYIGKPRDAHANAMAADYVARASRFARCEMRELRRGGPRDRHPGARLAALDPSGRAMDSAAFMGLIARARDEARDLVFLVGGAGGLPAAWRETADVAVSLSALTMPHELARVVVAEQIYRALAALKGHPYPR